MINARLDTASAVTLLAEMEQMSKRRVLLLSIGFAAILACLAVFLVIVNDQRAEAEQRAVRLEQTANRLANTLEQAREAYARQDLPRVGRLLGAAIVQAETIAQRAAVSTEGPPVDVAPPPAPTVTAQAATEAPAYRIPALDPALRRRVFIQFAGSIAREDVVALNRALAASGWDMQGRSGERTVKSAGLNEVRYHGEEDRAAALALAESITSSGLAAEPLTARQMSIIQPATLEVWMSR